MAQMGGMRPSDELTWPELRAGWLRRLYSYATTLSRSLAENRNTCF